MALLGSNLFIPELVQGLFSDGGFSILLPHFIKKLILTTLNPRVDLAFKKIFDAEENTQL